LFGGTAQEGAEKHVEERGFIRAFAPIEELRFSAGGGISLAYLGARPRFENRFAAAAEAAMSRANGTHG
jgi:hypothetical protein